MSAGRKWNGSSFLPCLFPSITNRAISRLIDRISYKRIIIPLLSFHEIFSPFSSLLRDLLIVSRRTAKIYPPLPSFFFIIADEDPLRVNKTGRGTQRFKEVRNGGGRNNSDTLRYSPGYLMIMKKHVPLRGIKKRGGNGGCKVRPRVQAPAVTVPPFIISKDRRIPPRGELRLRHRYAHAFFQRVSIQVHAGERGDHWTRCNETSRFFYPRESASVSPLSLPVSGWHKRRRERERKRSIDAMRNVVLTDIAVAQAARSLVKIHFILTEAEKEWKGRDTRWKMHRPWVSRTVSYSDFHWPRPISHRLFDTYERAPR